MTERFSGLVVILEDDIREDDAQPLIRAIAQLRGVMEVRPVTSRPGLEMVLRERLHTRLLERIMQVMRDEDMKE